MAFSTLILLLVPMGLARGSMFRPLTFKNICTSRVEQRAETAAHGKTSRESVFITAEGSEFKLIRMWGPGNQT